MRVFREWQAEARQKKALELASQSQTQQLAERNQVDAAVRAAGGEEACQDALVEREMVQGNGVTEIAKKYWSTPAHYVSPHSNPRMGIVRSTDSLDGHDVEGIAATSVADTTQSNEEVPTTTEQTNTKAKITNPTKTQHQKQ